MFNVYDVSKLESIVRAALEDLEEKVGGSDYCLKPKEHKIGVEFESDDPYCCAAICPICLAELLYKYMREGV